MNVFHEIKKSIDQRCDYQLILDSCENMNSTSALGSNVLESLSYLNQTAHCLVPDSVVFSSVVNYPYRLVLSFVDAAKLQYEQPLDVDILWFGVKFIKELTYYLLSSYAIASFVTALILNRIVIMASLRSTVNRVVLPLWSRVLLHLSSIIPLVYILLQVLCQYGIVRKLEPMEFTTFLSSTFASYAWSNCVETFVASTTNTLPLEESDYSIFELSILFYSLKKNKEHDLLQGDYLSDCLMAILGRLLVHLVELFQCRKYRLFGSTLLNCAGVGHFIYKVRRLGFNALPVATRYRNFPKIFSLFLIVMSVTIYSLAYFVRLDPFGGGGLDPQELQFYSFMRNWWEHLNCTGEEEFSSVVVKLAAMLSMGRESMSKGVLREFSHINAPSSIHHSYVISGYLNNISTIPEDIEVRYRESIMTMHSGKSNAPGLVKRFKICIMLLKHFFNFFRKSKAPEIRQEPSKKDPNRYVTEKNYAKFLTKPQFSQRKTESDSNQYLLPEDDLSGDYIPEQSDELEVDTEYDGSDDEDVGAILAPDTIDNLQEDLTWYISVWSILKSAVNTDTRLTRKQYAALEPQKILTEVVLERTTSRKSENDDDMDSTFACVVCKTNSRNVVLWPCKCFALCESCRVSLGLRGFNSCVCCRRDVHGYSKLHAI